MTSEDVAKLIEKECDAVKAMLLAKNKAYGNSALEPLRVFSKASVDELTDVIDPVLDHSLRLFFKADPPDANCVTTADGGCIGGLSAGMAPCLHDPR